MVYRRLRISILLALFVLSAGCSPSDNEKSMAMFASVVETYSNSNDASVEKLSTLTSGLDEIIALYPTSSVAQDLIKGSPIIQGRSLGEVRQSLDKEVRAIDYSSKFMELLTDYCIEVVNPEQSQLIATFQDDESLTPAAEHPGCYDYQYKETVYAVCLDEVENYCSVDVMLHVEDGLLFGERHITSFLTGVSSHPGQLNPNDSDLEQKTVDYFTDSGWMLKLDFPKPGHEQELFMVVSVFHDEIEK